MNLQWTLCQFMQTVESSTHIWDNSAWVSLVDFNGILNATCNTCCQNVKQRTMWKKAQNSDLYPCYFTGKYLIIFAFSFCQPEILIDFYIQKKWDIYYYIFIPLYFRLGCDLMSFINSINSYFSCSQSLCWISLKYR